jgi:hypothetical protein
MKKREELEKTLEDLEEDKLYYSFNIEHVEEVCTVSVIVSVALSLFMAAS